MTSGEPLVMVCHGSWARLRGWLGEPPPPPGCPVLGLLLPVRWVHTVGMRFDLDLVFLDAQGYVTATYYAVPPARIRGCWRARMVLELPAGSPWAQSVVPGAVCRLMASCA